MNLAIKSICLITFGLFLCSISAFSQDEILSPNEVGFTEETNTTSTSDELYYHRENWVNDEELIGLPDNKKDDFISGIKSPYEEEVWIYASRNDLKQPTSLYKYNSDRRQKTKLFSFMEVPYFGMSFVPIAFGNRFDVIYLEANDFINGAYSLGVWKYNLTTKDFTKLNITEQYMTTPVISVDRKHFYYSATSETNRNLVHGHADLLFSYDLLTGAEVGLDNSIVRSEVNQDGGLRSNTNDCLPAINTSVTYYFPLEPGLEFCMGRHGSSPPCPNGLPQDPNCNNHAECPHGFDPYGGKNKMTCTDKNSGLYIAFDVQNSSTHNDIYAAASGQVTFRGNQNGYGRCVEIKHADGYYTFYAHLSSFNVDMDEYVLHTTVIGKEGGSDYSGGTINDNGYLEHLHFEVRTSSGTKGSDYVKFGAFNNQSSNYRNTGTAVVKPVVPFFVSNIDLAPNCNFISVTQLNNNLKIENLQVSNYGDELSDGFKIYYSLEYDNTSLPLGSQAINSLNPFTTITIPEANFSIGSLPSYNYYLRVYVESDYFVTSPNPGLVEYDFTNNSCQLNTPIVVGGSSTSCYDGIQNQGELGVDCGGLYCSPCQTQINLVSNTCASPIVNGDQLTVLYEMANWGNYNSGAFYISWYLYKTGNGNPLPFGADTYHAGISANSSQVFQKTFMLSAEMNAANLTEGEYRIGFYIDTYSQIVESNENDNFCANYNYFNYNTVNLTHSANCLTTSIAGEYLNVYYDITNTGATDAGIFTIAWYAYEATGNNPIYLNTDNDHIGQQGNSTIPYSRSIHLPTVMDEANLPAGNYRLGYYIDTNDSVLETNESDNFCSSTVPFNYSGGCNRPDGYLDGAYNGSFEFSAPNWINAPQSGNQCIILSGGETTITAGQTIRLLPGFTAQLGSKFYAKIENCDSQNLVDPDEDSIPVKESAATELTDVKVYPNPFSGQSTIEFSLSTEKEVTVFVTDITGKRIAVLTEGTNLSDGTHKYVFDGRNASPGMYYCKIIAGNYTNIQKLILVN